jgi:hypothetical protein
MMIVVRRISVKESTVGILGDWDLRFSGVMCEYLLLSLHGMEHFSTLVFPIILFASLQISLRRDLRFMRDFLFVFIDCYSYCLNTSRPSSVSPQPKISLTFTILQVDDINLCLLELLVSFFFSKIQNSSVEEQGL